MKIKKVVFILLFCLIITAQTSPVYAQTEASVYHIDSVNGTRWQDYLCVYQNRATTEQNQWGYNIVVNSEGIVTEKIPSGDERGSNLAIPEGGMVVSGNGGASKEIYDAVNLGDNCLFDEYSMRVYFSKSEINPFYTKSISITGYNATRYDNTVILYNISGNKTNTNTFGYEVCVDADGYIISSGGNNSVVPEGGYVISAISSEDKAVLQMYYTVGAKCELKDSSVSVTYGKEQLKKTVEGELLLFKEQLEIAKSQYRLLDYDAIETAVSNIKMNNINTIQERNAIIKEIQDLKMMLVESKAVETRSVWYYPTETNVTDIKKIVAEMKATGINEVVLSTSSSDGTFVPIDTDKIPFIQDPIVQEFDILQAYIDECRANDISIVFLVPVFHAPYAETNEEWLDVTNTGAKRDAKFLSPANEEYRQVFMEFLQTIIDKYDIDGIQIDFVRYSQFYNGVDGGYDEATIKLFEEKTGNDASVVKELGEQLNAHALWTTWRNFKTELINNWVHEIYNTIKTEHPDVFLSAAVAASDNVRSYYQDPNTWVRNGYIDGIYVMSYSEGIYETSTNPFVKARGDDSYLVMGCGAYLSITNQSLIEQTDNAGVLGADGTAYFEWSAVVSHGYTEILKTLFKNDAIPYTADTSAVVDGLVATAKERILLYCDSTDTAKADELKNILSILPDTGADIDTLNNIISQLSSALEDDVEKYLTADLYSAVRALNIAVTELTDFTSDSNSDNANAQLDDEASESDTTEGAGLPIVWIVIGVAIILAIVATVTVVLNRKKQNQSTNE